MPFKISFSMTWLGWLLHSIIFSNKERKQIDSRLQFMLYFVWLFSFLINQKMMLPSSAGQDILRIYRLHGQDQVLQNVLSRTPPLCLF